MRATGLKKCRPIRRCGDASSPASCSSTMLEVLVASTACGFICGSSRAYSSRLASRFSKIASITTSACATPRPSTSAVRRAMVCSRFAGSSAYRFWKNARARCSAGVDVLHLAILQRNRQAARRTPARNVTAHDPGADDVHVPGRLAGCLARRLETILQEEHAHQVAGGRRDHQLRHRARFCIVGAFALRAVALPEVDQFVRSRVVLGAHAFCNLRAHLSRQNRSNERRVQDAIS